MEKQHSFDDIVSEILTWLPAKSLMRFKCLSKDWNTWICHPNFFELHHARSRTRPSATRLLFELLLCPGDTNIPHPKGRPSEGFHLELAPHYYFPLKERIIWSNHCNGLVCLYNNKESQAYLYNVTTGEIKALTFPVEHGGNTLNPHMFLGFDPVAGKYKLLKFHVDKGIEFKSPTILTLGTNSWRAIPGGGRRPLKCHFRYKRSIFLNGVLYSVASRTHIPYFNFTEEKFGCLSPPEHCLITYLNKIQTALCGKLVMHYKYKRSVAKDNLLYDDLNKVFTKFNFQDSSPKSALFEAERIDKTKVADILATSSIYGVPTSLGFHPQPLVFPDPFMLIDVNRFVENIIPLSFLL